MICVYIGIIARTLSGQNMFDLTCWAMLEYVLKDLVLDGLSITRW